MDFIELAKKRYSVRSYSNKKVEPEKLNRILQAAHVAPTAANLQPVHLIVVQDEDGLAKIGKGANIYGAPLDSTLFNGFINSSSEKLHAREPEGKYP